MNELQKLVVRKMAAAAADRMSTIVHDAVVGIPEEGNWHDTIHRFRKGLEAEFAPNDSKPAETPVRTAREPDVADDLVARPFSPCAHRRATACEPCRHARMEAAWDELAQRLDDRNNIVERVRSLALNQSERMPFGGPNIIRVDNLLFEIDRERAGPSKQSESRSAVKTLNDY